MKNNLEVKNPRRDASIPSVSAGLDKGEHMQFNCDTYKCSVYFRFKWLQRDFLIDPKCPTVEER